MVFPLLPVLMLVLAAVPQDKPASAREADLRRALAAGLAELAYWCRSNGLEAEAQPLVDEALALDPDFAKARLLAERPAGGSDAGEAGRKKFERKRDSIGRKLASLYLQLAREKHPPEVQPRFDGYLVSAFRFDPKGAAAAIDAAWREAFGRKDWSRAHRLLAGAEEVRGDPFRAKALKEVEIFGSVTAPLLRKASSHEMRYYLSVPRGWTPARKWHVVVGVEGAGCNWVDMIGALIAARGELPFILVTPVTISNTNDLDKSKYPYAPELLEKIGRSDRRRYDEEGLLAILDDLKRDFASEERFFITGFSGGGILCWGMVFGYPEKVAAAAPVCPNFWGADTVSQALGAARFAVRVFQGEKDHHRSMLEGQWELARRMLDEHGFRNYSYEVLPGRGHVPCAKETMEFFASQLAFAGNR